MKVKGEAVAQKESREGGRNVRGWSSSRVDVGSDGRAFLQNDEHKQSGSRAAQRTPGESHTLAAGYN